MFELVIALTNAWHYELEGHVKMKISSFALVHDAIEELTINWANYDHDLGIIPFVDFHNETSNISRIDIDLSVVTLQR
jgi:hypothetical protein